MARRTNGANGTTAGITRDDRIHALSTVEVTPGAPEAGGAPARKSRRKPRGAGVNGTVASEGSNGTGAHEAGANGAGADVAHAAGGEEAHAVASASRVKSAGSRKRRGAPDVEVLERTVKRDGKRKGEPEVEAPERSSKRKVAVKSAARGRGRADRDEGEARRARGRRGEGDEGAGTHRAEDHDMGSGYDSRDERAIAQEVSDRIRALLNEFGLDRLLGGASPKEMAAGLAMWLGQLVPQARENALGSLKSLLASEYLHPETWKGLLYVAQNAVEGARESRARRARGEYETDDFGFDQEFFESCIPVTRFLYEKWWRVDVSGLENVPDDKRSLIVANHSGILPFDGSMISQAIWSHHRSPRPVRWLYLKWFSSLPFVSILLSRAGGAMACPENGERLLEQDQLVGVFPEGLKGVGKLFKDRYKLARFGRGGFIKMAMRTRAPIIPVSVVGAEEIYPALTYLEFISKPLGMPMFPITPTFPWLGLLGLIPLPSKWSIHFGTPIRFNENAPAKVDDFLILSLLTEKVRGQIQTQIDDQLKLRKSVFFG